VTTQADIDDLIFTGWLHPEDPDRPLDRIMIDPDD
jgi:hypothetical protein